MARADVVIEAFRPGVAGRIGLGPAHARADAVYVSISGFGQSGPYAERPCTDAVAQAFSGLVSQNAGMDGAPHKVGTLPVDIHTGMSAFAAVQAALADRARDTTPRQRVLDCSLMAGAASLLCTSIAEAGLLGRLPAELNVPAGSYQAGDGAWVMIALVREVDWVTLVGVLGAPALLQDPRFGSFPLRAQNKPALLPMLRGNFLTRPAAEWIAALHAAGILASRVNTVLEWLEDGHVQASAAAPAVEQPGLGRLPLANPPGLDIQLGPAPALGEHSEDILREMGG
jgi:formyl-CoA transferase